MLLVQISDLHWRDDGAWPRHDPVRALERAFALVAAMRPAPDAIVFTGDVIDRSAVGYDAVARLLAAAPVPLLPLAGNHDRAEGFRAAFGYLADFAPGHLSFAAPLGEGLLVGLDSNGPGGKPGLDAARLDWLARVLDGQRVPVVLALHHPPFPTGIPRLDADAFPGTGALADLVATSAVCRVIAGHSHRAIHTLWAGVPASTAPALGHALALSLVEGAPHAHSAEPPGLHLHRMLDGQVVTHSVSLVDGSARGFAGPLEDGARALLIPS